MKLVGLLSSEDNFTELNLIAKIFLLEQHMKMITPSCEIKSDDPPPHKPSSIEKRKTVIHAFKEFSVHGLT